MGSIYDYKALTSNGKEYDFKELEGKVILIVNTASKCGFTPQFEGLEALNQKYKDRGLVIIGFPCNQFGHQDPGSDAEISGFCKLNYGVSFQMMKKVDVNGENAHPIFKYLKKQAGGFDIGFLEKVADRFSYREKKPHVFANMKAYFELLNGEFTCENIRKAMIKWEIAAKRTKAYLEKSNPSTDEKWVGMNYLDFRLETALRLFENQGNKL